jgi:capsular polysaccharide biosynthesis protein/Mrp family chromosome partitioning ATPase
MTNSSGGRTLRSLLKLAILPAVGVLAGLGAALLATSLIAPTYRATASVIIKPVPKKKGDSQVGDVNLALNLATSVARLAESREVASATAKGLHIPESDIFGKVTATSEPGNQIVTIQVEGASGQAVAEIANAAAKETGKLFTDLRPSGTSTIVVEALDDAAIPAIPIAPRPLLNNTLGAAAGLLIGIGVGSLLGRTEDRFRRLIDVERDLALPTLAAFRRLPVLRGGSASQFYRRRSNQLVSDGLLSAMSILGAADIHRRIVGPNAGGLGRRILVSSVGDDRATPFIAAVLAVSLSRHNQGTAVLEGERRRRGLARYTRGHGVRTVDHALGDGPSIAAASGESLTVLPIDEVTEYFGRQPRPEQLGALIDALAANADNVVITAPPVLAGPGLTALAEHADVVILVVASNRVNRAEAGRAALLVRRLGVALAGAVVTGAATDEDGWQPSAWKDPEADESADRAVWAGARRAAAVVRTDDTAGQLTESPRLKITTS